MSISEETNTLALKIYYAGAGRSVHTAGKIFHNNAYLEAWKVENSKTVYDNTSSRDPDDS